MAITSTLAAILYKTKSPLVVDEIRLPQNLLPNQVLVQLITSGICGAQINEIDAVKGPDRFLPHLLGHEGFARVLEVGPNVANVRINDFVVMHWRPGAGKQANPAVYEWQGKKLNSGWVTTFNNYCVVSENRVTKITGSNLDKNLMPLLGCALTTAYGVLKNDAAAEEKDSILIVGAGGVGLALIKIANFLKIKNITVVDLLEQKLEVARKLGATYTVRFVKKSDTLSELSAYFKGDLPTIAIDTSGNMSAIELCYEISAPTGRVVLVGVPKAGTLAKIHTLPLHFGKILKGSHGGGCKPHTDIKILLDQISTNAINFSDYPIKKFSLHEINDAILDLRSGMVGRMIIDFEL